MYTQEALSRLTFDQSLLRIQYCEMVIQSTTRKGVKNVYQQMRDRLYNRCAAMLDSKISDQSFMVFLSLDGATLTINL